MVAKTDFAAALAAQADNLDVTVRVLAEALGASELPPWQRGETIAVVAMGASTHSGEALVAALRAQGVRGVNLTASDLELVADGFQPADHYILVSESGRSPEPIRAAHSLTPGRRIGITNDPEAPLCEVVDHLLPLGGWQDSKVYTSGFTATLLTYAALVRHQLGEGAATAPTAIPGLVRRVMDAWSETAGEAATLLEKVHALDFVARGTSFAAAAEGALVVREGARIHTTAYETYQYIHGPMEPLASGSGLVVFGDDRELPMVDMVLDHGVKVVLLTQRALDELPRAAHENLLVVPVPAEASGIGRAVVETVFTQMFTLEHTRRAGIDINEFLYEQPDTKLQESTGQ